MSELSSNTAIKTVNFTPDTSVIFQSIKWTPTWSVHQESIVDNKLISAANQLAKEKGNSMSFAVPELAFNYLMLNTAHFSVRDFMSCLDPAGLCLQQLMWHLHVGAAKEVSEGTVKEKTNRVSALETLLNSKDKELTQAQSIINQ